MAVGVVVAGVVAVGVVVAGAVAGAMVAVGVVVVRVLWWVLWRWVLTFSSQKYPKKASFFSFLKLVLSFILKGGANKAPWVRGKRIPCNRGDHVTKGSHHGSYIRMPTSVVPMC
ncbi:hypothetical protein MNL13_06325 [Bartonella krasnovii]|uniref:Uncharacterized protein n=1 Tax=Bartonella krasnovii TaxID=2267275 RepID=A0ABY3W1U1_9HYPH|nr:hypothetical protein [Bartonella krasnovii]UNF30042.1 hypothetical protein MNL13_06325 [Bartonella krasnovii]